MHIIGFNCYGHDASASLLDNGKIIGAASEERFTRDKLTGVFPSRALEYCLSLCRGKTNKLDYAGFPYNPYKCALSRIFNLIRNYPQSSLSTQAEIVLALKIAGLREKVSLLLKNVQMERSFRFLFVEHHLAHAASAFYPSPFAEAAIFSIDGVGEWCTTLLAYGNGEIIQPLKRIYFPNSIGLLYAAVTQYLGFEPLSDEYKVMGLASYGQPVYYDKFRDILQSLPKAEINVSKRYVRFHTGLLGVSLVGKEFLREFGPPYTSDYEFSQKKADIAASLQKVTEEAVLDMLKYLRKHVKTDNLCLAGGVALNCAMNGRILRENIFKNIFVQPAANDSGTSLGAALYIYHAVLRNKRRDALRTVYLGPEYDDCAIETIVKENKLRYERYNNLEEIVAGILSEGNVVGWFQGRMEFGPRALGARSILADPRRQDMKDIINKKIKHREPFRPFAPSVIEECANDFFKGCSKSPFMTFVYPVRPEKKDLIPAVTHVDGTSRVQTVNRHDNPRYWRLIKEFEKKTGVGVILNTSFNIKGEPIVCSPEDALRCFYSTGLDYLAIGDYLISK